MELGGIHHLALKTSDVERLAAFYTGVLGLTELRRFTNDRGVRSIWLALGTSILMIERSDAACAGTSGPLSDGTGDPKARFIHDPPGLHLAALSMAPADRAAWRARFEGAGLGIVHETAYTLYVLDPDGNRVGLSSYPEPSA
ncbi:VOC family protein [Myxococcota bacterium]|nr:VOC family protein [Myxococcota bacterium]